MADQDGHVGRITTALGADALLLEGFTAVERFSTPFHITCDVLSLAPVDFGPHLGSGVSLTVDGDDDLSGKAFHGLLAGASRIGEDADAVRYRLELRPWFWFLSLGRDSRIFQAKTVPTIVGDVFTAAGISTSAYDNELTQTSTVARDYCVQFGESDFDFVSRLLEEEGVYYFFRHTADAHVMVLCDGKSSHDDFAGGALPLNRSGEDMTNRGHRLWTWNRHVQPTATSVTHRDFHLRRYNETLQAATTQAGPSSVAAEVYLYPGGYSHQTDDGQTAGTSFVGLRLQAAQAEAERFTGAGDVFAVPVGDIASVGPAAGDDGEADEVLVIGATHVFAGQRHAGRGEGEPLTLTVMLEAIPADTTWRPPLVTPKPVARGPQTAIVVGPSGEVISTDAYGRVKVQFPWDRQGQSNETSSCWIRVSQSWADGGFGHMHIPRIGEEVIVDYFDGDMDRPVITGRVYNATKAVPYGLPDEKTKSTWKSQTVGDAGDYPDTVDPPPSSTKGFNEIRFEDKGGSEEIFVHAQRLFTGWYRFDETRTTGHNTTITVGYNRDITIKNNESKTVQEGDETHTISQGSLTTTISQGDETRTVSTGKRTTSIKSDESLTVTDGNMSTTVSKGNQSTDVTMGDITVNADAGSISVTAMQKIELTVGANSVKIDTTGVTVNGIKISLQATAMLEEKAPMTQLEADAMTTIKAPMVMIN